MSKVDSSSPADIRAAIYAVLASGRHESAEKVLNTLLKAPAKELVLEKLWAEFGAGSLSLTFGTLCKEVAKELGELTPPPYALADRITTPDGKALRLKPSVVKAMGG